MGESIKKLVKSAHEGNKYDLELLIKQFDPLLKSTAFYLGNEDSYQEIVLFFIELIRLHDFSKMTSSSDKEYVAYISKAVHRQAKHISKCHQNIVYFDDLAVPYEPIVSDNHESLLLDDCKKRLTKKEYQVIVLFFLKGYSIEAIAKMFHISRQTVNTTRRRALKKLKSSLTNMI